MVTEHTLAVVAVESFIRDGDTSGLSAWADQLAEVGNIRGEKRIRVLLARDEQRRENVRFFARMSGRVRGEHEQLDRIKAAMGIARIERWAAECCEVEWVYDTDYDPNQYDSEGVPETAFGCIVRWNENRTFSYRSSNQPTQSLWGITFGDGFDPTSMYAQDVDVDTDDGRYKRFVEAELAEELFGEVMCLDR